MTPRIEAEQVRRIVALARLHPSGADEEGLAANLGKILAYVDKLREIDTSRVPASASVLSGESHGREDEPGASLAPDDALRMAPRREGGFFVVPRVIE